MNDTDLAYAMLEKLSAKDHLSDLDDDLKSKIFLQVIVECLNKAAACFEMADKDDHAEKITNIMEKLTKAGE